MILYKNQSTDLKTGEMPMAENAVHLLTGGSQIRIWPQQSQQNQESSKSNRVPHWNSAEER